VLSLPKIYKKSYKTSHCFAHEIYFKTASLRCRIHGPAVWQGLQERQLGPWIYFIWDHALLLTDLRSCSNARVGHGLLFQNPTQPKISGLNPTHKSLHPTQPNPSSTLGMAYCYTSQTSSQFAARIKVSQCHWKSLFSYSTH